VPAPDSPVPQRRRRPPRGNGVGKASLVAAECVEPAPYIGSGASAAQRKGDALNARHGAAQAVAAVCFLEP
jgi:hypothetical protein